MVTLVLAASACGGERPESSAPIPSADPVDARGLIQSVEPGEVVEAPAPRPVPTSVTAPSSGRIVDLTDAVATLTSPSCADHAGRFHSSVTDRSTGAEVEGSLVLATDGQTCTLLSNQAPNHDFGRFDRASPEVVEPDRNESTEATGTAELLVQITAHPVPAETPTPLGPGPSAVLLNGVRWEAGTGTPGAHTPALDDRGGHVDGGGAYHYHGPPPVLHQSACDGGLPSPVIGFAADGFPIHGPCFRDPDGVVRPAVSSHRPSASGTAPGADRSHEFVAGLGDLDRCNGMTVDGHYGYYLTEAYPYVMSCYRGTPTPDVLRTPVVERPPDVVDPDDLHPAS